VGAIDGAGFGHAHSGVAEDEKRNIAGMSITVADEATAPRRFEDSVLEDPEILLGATQSQHRLNLDPRTMAGFCEGEQLSMSDVERCFVRL
jgi:hypothetical protein